MSLASIAHNLGHLSGPGIRPMDLRVLVLPDDAERVTKGGIIIPPPAADREQHAQMKATIVSVGELAFREAARMADDLGLNFDIPKEGDRVLIGKYSGNEIIGADEVKYRLLNDADIIARLEE